MAAYDEYIDEASGRKKGDNRHDTMLTLDQERVQRLDPIVYSEPCSGTINDSRRTTLFKDYDKVQHYLDDFFGSIADINALPKDADPVFITGASSNHVRESIVMFNNFNSVVRKIKPNVRMIFYDLGLQAGELDQIKAICQCEYRLFPFEKFPAYVKELKGYAWKPLSIMGSPFGRYLHTRRRIRSSSDTSGDVRIFREKACTFRNLSEIQAGFFIARTTPFVVQNILKPWIACALVIDCIVPHEGWQKYYRCGLHGNVYGDCHRYEQSVLAILLYRAYGYDIYKRMERYEGDYVYLPWPAWP
ncbi:uncharacterized protein LOC127849867 [Dreissena polymorpha]|uniref:uncharacterized protein LOC127849867 n=1 Tax=Dreissena polymorpha TaxID=45954 RepID=UPI002263B5E2|nr:uncharacterized protein LOC127849867 [Dreissena polymorpha]